MVEKNKKPLIWKNRSLSIYWARFRRKFGQLQQGIKSQLSLVISLLLFFVSLGIFVHSVIFGTHARPTSVTVGTASMGGLSSPSLPQALERPTALSLRPPKKQTTITRVLKDGETLEHLLLNNNVQLQEISQITEALRPFINFGRLQVGQSFELLFDQDNRINRISLAKSVRENAVAERVETVFRGWEESRPLSLRAHSARGEIKSSLYQASLDQGIPDGILMEFIRLYSFDVDFQRDIHPGDAFEVTYETFSDEKGNLVDQGEILFSKLFLGDQVFSLYRYEPIRGQPDYFNEAGHTARKALLKTPIDGAYLTDGFGKRRHPIFGYTHFHRGVDFGARTGTPIFAAGSGTIIYRGWGRGYGNYVKISHLNGFVTLYAHMSRFKRGQRKGSRVRQGEVIGYVGSTGLSTGPHLHYEVHKRGRVLNPSRLRFSPEKVLTGTELKLFQRKKQVYLASYQSREG